VCNLYTNVLNVGDFKRTCRKPINHMLRDPTTINMNNTLDILYKRV